MHRLKTVALSFAASLVALLTMFSSSAVATSGYDSVYKSTSSLTQSGNRCSDQDLTNNWSQYLTSDEFSGLKDSFDTAVAQGRWGVSVAWGQVHVFWTEDTSLYLDWNDPSYGGGYAVMAKGNGIHNAEFSMSNTYYPKVCTPYVSSYTTDGNANTFVSDRYGNNKNLFVNTDHPNYPSGYEGASIPAVQPSTSTGSAPSTTLYNGTIDCGNDSLVYMRITQDGNTYSVPLNFESVYRAGWNFSLTDSPYTITVGCGLGVAASFGSVTPMPPTSNDWICDTIHQPKYCVLS